MSATVANTALVGEAARIARAYGSSSRPMVDGAQGAKFTAGREQAGWFDGDDLRSEPGARRRRAEFQDQVISFGGVLVSLEVGSTIVEAQTLNGLRPTLPADAERQVATYEFAQSLFGPAVPIDVTSPFTSMAHAAQ